jgi:hypothetical protein
MKKVCNICKEEFIAKRPEQQFCSVKCHNLYMISSEKECAYCNKKFHSYHGRKSIRFCSSECFNLSFKGRQFSVAHREKLSEAASKRLYKSYGHSKFKYNKYITKSNKTVLYQSSLELKFIKYCENKKIELENGPKVKYFFNNANRTYTIDFQTANYLIEIKGDHHWYKEGLKSGKIEAKSSAAKLYGKSIGKDFLLLVGSDSFKAVDT